MVWYSIVKILTMLYGYPSFFYTEKSVKYTTQFLS